MRNALVAAALLVSGCVAFVPTYNAEIYSHLDAVKTDISKLYASAQIGKGSIDYATAKPIYADALGHVHLAEIASDGRVDYLRDKIAVTPATDISQSIKHCDEALVAAQQLNEAQQALTSKDLGNAALAEVCDVAKTMENRLNKKKG